MYYSEVICCLCLNVSNSPLIDLHSKCKNNLTHFDKIESSLSQLAAVINETSCNYMFCEKCCETVEMIYKFNHECLNNIKTYSFHRFNRKREEDLKIGPRNTLNVELEDDQLKQSDNMDSSKLSKNLEICKTNSSSTINMELDIKTESLNEENDFPTIASTSSDKDDPELNDPEIIEPIQIFWESPFEVNTEPREVHRKKKKKLFLNYPEENMINAMEDVKKGVSIKKAATKYGVPRTTLLTRIRKKTIERPRMGPSSYLPLEHEQNLVKWIVEISKTGLPVTKEHLIDNVAKLVTDLKIKNPFKNNRPGRKWFQSFLRRHPEISTIFSHNQTQSEHQ